MSEFELAGDLFLLPTPAGAYHAVSTPEDSLIRRLVLALLRHRESPQVSTSGLCEWLGTTDEQEALEVLFRAQTLAWIEGFEEPHNVPGLGVGDELHKLLPQLSSVETGLIVDWNGLSLASCGVDDEMANALSALSADLIGVQERHSERLQKHLGLSSHGWAAVDAYGSSRIGAWPLYIGDKRMLLVLMGEPLLNQSAFLTLVWVLINNYG
ncbi:MAG: hypothetical protein QNJ00_18470 [Woeseiaceae bacterium]|nr:hypothetical protein [Woeseiaceae bacterium]